LECSLEILVASFFSAKANLWIENGDIIGGILAYLSMILVIAVLPTIGVYISF
jgi:hypothetical protein